MMNAPPLFIVLLFTIVDFISTTTYTCNPTLSCGCSVSSTAVTARIVGGEPAPNHTWGWAVSFQYYGEHICGASLLTSDAAVTAAHCVYDVLDQLSSLSILVGTNYLDDTSSTTMQRRSIIQISMNPLYDPDPTTNDIAILRFSPLKISSNSQLAFICLPNPNQDPFQTNSSLVAIGWGVTAEGNPDVSNYLQQVTVQAFSSTSADCLRSGLTNSSLQFCAGVSGGGKDTCQGDSGGPLMAFVNNTWVLAGITSFGWGCAQPGFPGVYTRVSNFISFINSNVNSSVPNTTMISVTTSTSESNSLTDNTTYTCDPTLPCGCSVSSTAVTARIVGGEAAPNHAWGWAVSFQQDGQHMCGASLLTPDAAVTAAHCVYDVLDQLSSLSILVGTNYLDDTSSTTMQRRSIMQITMNPLYDPDPTTNDIAILRFTPLTISSNSELAFLCLPNENQDPFQTNSSLVAIGWGVTAEGNPDVSNYLQQVTVQAFSSTSADCLQSGLTNSSLQFCAGISGGGKDTCQGDSGGPLMAFVNNTWVLAGITSFGQGCAQPGFPGVYTRVSNFISFINSNVNSSVPNTTVITNTTYTCDPTLPCGCSVPSTVLTARIVGGEAAPNHAWGWAVSFQQDGQHMCGASLLTPDAAVTAAHCVYDFLDQLSSLSIVVGTNYLDDTSSTTMQRRSIIQIRMNPLYDPDPTTNDIAILRFTPLTISSTSELAFICLPNPNQDPFQTNSSLVAIGWGVTYEGSQSVSNYLQQVTVQAFSSTSTDCLKSGLTNSSLQFCAGINGGGKDTCQGDSGGPLMAFVNNTWVLAGLTSFGRGCAEAGYPGIYTRVSNFISFINSNVNSPVPNTTMISVTTSTSESNNLTDNTTYTCDPTLPCGCSVSSTAVTARIVGGEAAPNHAWGWAVSFQQDGQHMCGASLLTSEYAVTAAHCVYDVLDQLSSLSILVGTNYLDDTSSTTMQRRSIIQITMNPLFESNNFTNDIAILRFSPLTISSNSELAFICLPNANQDPFQTNSSLVAIGWGVTAEGSLDVSNYLQQVTVQAFSYTSADCLQSGLTNSSLQFCAGISGGGKDTCQGDSGGPLMAFVNNTWVLAGITSFGQGCAEAGYPGVYTRVSNFISFIDSNVNSSMPNTTMITVTTSTSESNNLTDNTTYTCDPTLPCGCTVSSTAVTARIVGGEAAPNHAWGWAVSFQINGRHRCGASLLTSQYAVTAAHCVYGILDQLSSLSILVGTNYLDDTSSTTMQRRSVIQITMNLLFNPGTTTNDIAILRFSSLTISSNSHLAFICLPNANQDPFQTNSNLVAIGWGVTYEGSQSVSNYLQQVTVQAFSSTSADCLQSGLTNSSLQFCAGVSGGGKDTCQGDSGGPLMAFVNNRWVLVGLTSFGQGCAEAGYPGVYTRVSSFISFINTSADLSMLATTQSNHNEANIVDKSIFISMFWFSLLLFSFASN